MSDFIKPELLLYKNFQDLVGDKEQYAAFYFSRQSKGLDFKDIIKYKNLFVIGEPGFGKTRLLKEAFLELVNSDKQVIFIDLKKSSSDVEAFIKANAEQIDSFSATFDLEKSSLFRSANFKLRNSAEVVVLLDALDEVKYQDLPQYAEQIKFFLKKYDNAQILISCRYHHFQKNKQLFSDIVIDYLRLVPFSRNQVKDYLRFYNLNHGDIEQVIRILEFSGRDLVIQTPRYLSMVVQLIKEKGLKAFLGLTKTNVFELFIYKKLEAEDGKLNTQTKEIVKRVLEKIALIMEIYQTNLITKEDLITILDDVKSNLNISFLNQNTLDIFYDRTILKDNIETVEFENTEFQEYLAAKEIVRLGKTDQIVFDLVVDPESREIYPSWFNSLGFVVDLEPTLLKLIIKHVLSQGRVIKSEEYFRFLTKVDAQRLSREDRIEIFEKVFGYFDETLHWIPYDIAEDLALYYDPAQNTILKNTLNLISTTSNDGSFVRKGNLAYLVGFLCERKKFSASQERFWISQLNKFLKDSNEVVQRHALLALSRIGDMRNLIKAKSLLNTLHDLVLENLIEACKYIDPNHAFSIECFVEGQKRENVHARYGFYEITERRSIKALLRYFVADEQFLLEYIDQEKIFKDKDQEVINNISKVWDKEIFKLVDKIICAGFASEKWFQVEESKFIRELMKIMAQKDQDYIFKLLDHVSSTKKLQDHLFSLKNILPLLLHSGQVGKFVSKMKSFQNGDQVALWTLDDFRILGTPDAKKIYEEGRAHYPDAYKRAEEFHKNRLANSTDERKELYKKFLKLLEPEKGKFHPDVFTFYLNNKDKLQLQNKDLQRLKKLITETAIGKFDPGKQTLTWSKNGGEAKSYTTSTWIYIFGKCLAVAVDLKLNVRKSRRRILNYIPFAYSEHLKAIFELVPNPSPSEIRSLLKVYKNKRKDDLQTFMPSSFIEACEKYRIEEAVPILKTFVDNTSLSTYDRRTALKGIGNLLPRENYLKQIFNKYKNEKNETAQLAEIANEYLINNFKDKRSILWRLKQLAERSIAYVQSKGVHWVPAPAGELHDKHFARPIMSLKDPAYLVNILELLDNSFRVLDQGDNYREYTGYLWDIVLTYFENLREQKSFSYYRKLENYILKNKDKNGINWFSIRMGKLLRSYVEYLGKPETLSVCIKKYNGLKQAQYLNVSTVLDLVNVIKDSILTDLTSFVEEQGFYKTVQEVKGKQEDLIQKTLKTQLENCFAKRGLRLNEVNIRREEQLLDDKRTDYLVSYGFIGPILMEIKRNDREEVCQNKARKEYKKTLLQYIGGTNSHSGIFLVLRINEQYDLEGSIKKLKETYKDCENVEIYGLDCLKSFSNK